MLFRVLVRVSEHLHTFSKLHGWNSGIKSLRNCYQPNWEQKYTRKSPKLENNLVYKYMQQTVNFCPYLVPKLRKQF